MRRTVVWLLVSVSVGLVLSAAAGIGEARLLAERGVTVATIPAEDGSRWIHGNGSLYEARTDGPAALADPTNHALNAASVGAHLRGATVVPAALALLALGIALVLRRRLPLEFPPEQLAEVLPIRGAVGASR